MDTHQQFAKQIINWHDQYGRHDLPWQKQPNAYRVWVSEIMLQQTQVGTVIPYYHRFIKRFKSIKSLATAEQDEVLSHWSGLGYYARARNLHRSAQIIHQQHRGRFPTTVDDLCQLPGIGRSTAGAILSLSMGQAAPILDGNVKRVLCRVHSIEGWPGNQAILQQLWTLAEDYTPKQNTAQYNQAIMDLGATLCTRRQPQCDRCPVQQCCQAQANNTQHDYPTPKPRKTMLIKKTFMIIILNSNNEVLLEKRPPSGIWGSLWSFPEYHTTKGISDWIQDHYNLETLSTKALPNFSHQFSHFKLNIHPLLISTKTSNTLKVMENSPQIWYKIGHAPPGGLAKPVQQLLTEIKTQESK